MAKWISIKDRLPKADKLVICGDVNENWVVSGSINKKGQWFNQFQDSRDDCEIYPTHWRSMPSFQGPPSNFKTKVSGTEETKK